MTRLFPRTKLFLSGSMISPKGSRVGVSMPLLFKAPAFFATPTPAALTASGVLCIKRMASHAVGLLSPFLRSGRITPSALSKAVPHVVGASSEKEMVRSHARRVIAVVANVQAFGNWAIRHLPRDTVGALLHLPDSADIAIAKSQVASPHPACRAENGMHRSVFVDLLPESLSKGTRFGRHDANISNLCALSYDFLGASA